MKFLAFGRMRWVLFLMGGLIVATVGLKLGKTREAEYMERLYARTDFTLLDDENEFFRLKDFPKEKLLLLIFTPDALNPEVAIAFRGFSSHLADLRKRGVEPMMITRTNREIARNFKSSAEFKGRLLIDLSGTVGKNIGIWENNDPAMDWGYAVLDSSLHVYWTDKEHVPLSYQKIWDQLESMK